MTIDNFFQELAAEGMSLKTLNGDLALSGAEGKLSKEQLMTLKQDNTIPAFIKANKQLLIDYLSKNGNKVSKKIKKEDIERIYKLSPLQEGILFHCLYNDEITMYITQFRMDIPKGLNEAVFRKSWNFVIQNHTILRTGFIYDKVSIPIQCVHKTAEVPMEVLDYTPFTKEEQEQKFKELCIENRDRKFDFQKPPLIRITLVKTDEEAYKVILTKHHILWDGWSDQLIISEVLEAYAYFIKGQEPPSVRVDRYEDYIKFIDKIDPFKEKRFWETYFDGFEEPSLLPFSVEEDRNKGGNEFEKIRLLFNKTYSEKITRFAQSRKITKNNLIKGVWSLLLSNYTGKDDIAFGLTVSGRPQENKYSKKVGLFINAIPVRCKINKEENISDWLFNLQQDQTQSLEYQYSSLQQIQHWAKVKGDLFDCLLNVRNYPKPAAGAIEETVLPIENVEGEENNNYLFSIEVGLDEEIAVDFKYNSHLLSEERINLIKNHFDHAMRQIVDEAAELVGEVEVITPEEATQIIEDFNDTTVTYPKEKSTVQLISEQAAKTPNATAVIFGNTVLTYEQLENQSNQFARCLQSKGVGTGNTVGICVDRSIEMMIGLMGIMKTGNAYIPLDPTYPKDRIAYIMEDSEVNFLVSTKAIRNDFEDLEKMEWIFLDQDYSEFSAASVETSFSPDDLVYLIYTSGTTGRPKGVMIEQQPLVNYLSSMQSTFQLDGDSTWFAVTTYSFDISYLELYLPLLNGAAVVIADDESLKDGIVLQKLIQKYKPTHMQATPSTWQLLIDSDWKNEVGMTVISGGEAIRESLKESLVELTDALWNLYGPTETTIYSSIQELKKGIPVNIGQPIANTQIYILDPRDQLCQIGVEGELCIGGDGLARGYRNRPDLTAEKFFKNNITGKGRLYRTGDLAKWLPSGELEYISRKDDQVKIRGFRIELEEIQNVMEEWPTVNQSVVLANQDKTGVQRLVAYMLTEGAVEKADIKAHMQTKLPAYMVPDIIIEMETFPKTLNGKLNKKAFPKPGSEYLVGENFVRPTNETQKRMVEIWKNILELDNLGIQDNFFELGGHSLMAMRTISAINRELSVDLRIKNLFENPTIEELEKVIKESSGANDALRITTVNPRPEQLPLTFSQERLWFIHTLTGSEHYHLPMVEYLDNSLDIAALEFALNTIISRHEALRTVIQEEQGIPYQEILPIDSWSLEVEKKETDNLSIDLQTRIEQEINRPFDLSYDHMLRAKLFNRGKDGYALVIVLHHIAADAWSGNIFIQEMVDLYLSRTSGQINTLVPLNIQYADYALWQQAYFNDTELEKQISYWEEKLDGISTLNLPLDYPRPRVQSTNGESIDFAMDAEMAKRIKDLCKEQGLTLFMFLLAAFKVLLSKYAGQEDICVGTPVANRNQPEIENLIGFFVNTITLRSNLADNPSFIQFLDQLKSTTLEAYQYQDTPFEKIVDRIVEERGLSTSPLFQVAFALQNVPFDLQLNETDHASLPIDMAGRPEDERNYKVAKYDLAFNIIEGEEAMKFSIDYCTDLFKSTTIERMGEHFQMLIQSILERPDASVNQLMVLTDTERNCLLNDFNNTEQTYPKEKTIVDLFETQVAKTPEETAVFFDGETLTYRALDQKANQLANFLRKSGAKEESRIGLCMDRSLELVIGIIGILKAGAAYVPIDTAYPQERINYILEDAQINLVLGNESSAPLLSGHDNVLLDKQWMEIEKESDNPVKNDLKPQNLVYVIYTSGSTGLPKGVMIEHQNLTNYVNYGLNNYNAGIEAFNFPLFTSLSFDLTQTSIFLSLLSGGCLYVETPTNDVFELLAQTMSNEKLNSIKLTPSHVQLLEGMANSSIKKVILGGEALELNHLSILERVNPEFENFNEYGPTEATIGCTVQRVQASGEEINIGVPIWNTQVYLLDNNQKMVPMGVPGELCIGGDGLARGYLNRPELTADKFVTVQLSDGKNQRIYRTGDLAKWQADGTLFYMGRIDEQMKINGFRIAPGEIESLLNKCEVVVSCAINAKVDSNGHKRLCAYIVPGEQYDKETVRDFLKQSLPDTMIPSIWITLEDMPLTPNGKIDRNNLPEPDFSDLIRTDYIAPRNETEERLATIWKEILDVPQVGIYDQFFDLGGHSLLMARMVAAIRDQMEVELPLKAIFQYPRLIDLADYLIVLNGFQEANAENEYEVLDL